jgi:hypothetical protein
MSINQNSSPIDTAKKKAKHLHSILKVRIPEISLGECLNSYARMEGARDWNTFSATLKKQSAIPGALYQKLDNLIDSTLRPVMMKIGQTHGMDINVSAKTLIIEKKDADNNISSFSPSKKFDVTFQPQKQSNTYYTFQMEISSEEVSAWSNDITFIFPEDHPDIPMSILAGKRVPLEITPRVLRNTDRGQFTFNLILETEPFFEGVRIGKEEIWDFTDRIEYFGKEMDESIRQYSILNIAFQKLSKHWSNKKLQSSFETSLWKVFTGTPRFMSAPTEFHSAPFGDITLAASASEWGPMISGPDGVLNLGVSSIIYCEADKEKPAGYYIAKYGNSHGADIYLKGIVKDDILRITSEFGVPPGYELAEDLGIPIDDIKDEYIAFYRSQAFKGLQDWVSRNRSFAKKIRHGAAYIPDWYERATGQRPVPDSDEELIKEGREVRKNQVRKSGRKEARA